MLEFKDDILGSQEAPIRAADIARRIGDRRGLNRALQQLSRKALREGRGQDSVEALQEAIGLVRGLGDQAGVAAVLDCGYEIALRREADVEAATFFFAAAKLRQRLGIARGPRDTALAQEAERVLIERLGAERYAQVGAQVQAQLAGEGAAAEMLERLESWLVARE